MNTNMNTMMHAVLKRGDETQVSFIPSQFAQEGRYLKLKNRSNGSWEDGWRVAKAYPPLISADIVVERERDYANHRKATDV